MHLSITILVNLLFYQNSFCANLLLNLAGKWSFSSSNGSVAGVGTVPGDIFSDLYAAGIIDNPLYGENHLNLKWIGEDDWTYTRTFFMRDVKTSAGIFLDLESLDTIATVYINEQKVLHSRNQFLAYHVNVTDLIQEKENSIKIKFKSPVNYSNKKAEEYEKVFAHKLPPDCNPDIYHGECHQNFIRKAQYSYSWDWGPSFPTVGVPAGIWINQFNGEHFHDFTWKMNFKDDHWHLEFDIETFHYGARTVEYIVKIPELSIKESDIYLLSATHSMQMRSRNKLKLKIPSSRVPERWWPNGMGDQKMYKVVVSLGSQIKTKQIGFKTVELVQDLVDPSKPAKGRNFYFKINGQPLFLKGTNWIPISMFPANETNIERMKFLIDSMAAVGMNVVRAWGGGFYESEDFYSYTSKKGILVWQDLMFACALYPTTEEFVKNVEDEVSYQVDRISQYTSLLVISGNNENEAAIRGHWWRTVNYTESQQVKDYVLLYTRLARIAKQIAPDIPFIMSSPSNGVESEEEGGVAKNPYDVRYGDIHYYNEYVNLWRDDTYQTPRCASEYGIQSYPLKETMLNWINESDWEYTSKAMFHRQHHPGGHVTNLLMIFQHLPIPAQCESRSFADIHRCEYITSREFMSRLAYFSQIHQAIALKTQTFHYRRFRNITTNDGLGNTMCAMYWQLNDVWAAPTWSSIDFDLKWKMAHYEAKRFFSDTAVYSFADETDFNLKVFILNDKAFELQNLTVTVTMLSWANGLDPILTNDFHVKNVPAGSSQSLDTGMKFDSSAELSEYLYVSTLFGPDEVILHEDVLVPDFLFEVDFNLFGNVQISEIKQIDALTYEITITTDKVSPFTWLSCSKPYVGWFSDNGFHMTSRLRKVNLILREDTDLQKSDFAVCNLKNCYV